MYEQTYWIVTGISVIFFLERGVTTFSNSSMTINATADMKGANLSIPTRIRYTSLLLLGIVTTVGLVEVGHQLGWGGSEFLLGFKPEMIWVGLLGCITSMISAKIDTKIKQKFYEEFKLKDSDNEFRRQRISELRNRLREQSKSMRKMEPETKRTKKALEDAKRKSRSNKKTIDRWNSENKQMMKKVDEAKAERKRMDKEINAATKENAEIESELTDIENKNQIILKEIKSLQTKRRSKSSQLADKEKQYNQLVTTFVADEKMNSKQKKEINRINNSSI